MCVHPEELKEETQTHYFHTGVHSIIVHNSQRTETTRVSVSRRTARQDVAGAGNGALLNHDTGWNSDTCYDTVETYEHYVQGKKSGTKEQRLYDSTDTRFLRAVIGGIPPSGGDGELLFSGYRASLWNDSKFCKRMVMMVAQQVNILNAWIVHWGWLKW